MELALTDKARPPKARFILARNPKINLSLQTRRFACSYLLNKLLLLTLLPPKTGWHIYNAPSGAPRILNKDKSKLLTISIARSKEWLSVGIALDAQIGIDIQCMSPRNNFQAMAKFLNWKGSITNLQVFHKKWTLWEAAAKCVEGSVLMKNNLGFDKLYHMEDREDCVNTNGRWNGIHGCIEENLFYSVVLQCQKEEKMNCHTLETGKIMRW